MSTRKKGYMLKADLSDMSKYYPSLDPAFCKQVLRKKIKDPVALKLSEDMVDLLLKSTPKLRRKKNAPA